MSLLSMEVSREEVEAAFNLLNKDESGVLEISKLKLAMRGLGFEPRNQQIEEMTQKIREMKKQSVTAEKTSKETIDVDEFMELISGNDEKVDKSSEEMRSAFKLFDKEGKGWISVDNLKQVAKELGEEISGDELKEMIKEAAMASDGKVRENDFFAIMKKTCLY